MFRLSSHNLKIETGRWTRQPRELRLCLCGQVQDEMHVIQFCPLTERLRYFHPTPVTFPGTLIESRTRRDFKLIHDMLNVYQLYVWKFVCVEIVKTWWNLRYIRCSIGTPCLRDHIGCGLGQWGTPLRRPHWLVPHPEWSLLTLYHCAKTSLSCCILLCSVTFTEPLYCRPVRNTALLWAVIWGHPELGIILGVVSANGGRHYVAPHWLVPYLEWSLLTLYHCAKTSFSCCILLCSVTFTVFQCVSELNRFIVDLSETPRYFGPRYRDTPT